MLMPMVIQILGSVIINNSEKTIHAVLGMPSVPTVVRPMQQGGTPESSFVSWMDQLCMCHCSELYCYTQSQGYSGLPVPVGMTDKLVKKVWGQGRDGCVWE